MEIRFTQVSGLLFVVKLFESKLNSCYSLHSRRRRLLLKPPAVIKTAMFHINVHLF